MAPDNASSKAPSAQTHASALRGRPAAAPDDLVVSPNGYFYPSCIVQVGKDDRVTPRGGWPHAKVEAPERRRRRGRRSTRSAAGTNVVAEGCLGSRDGKPSRAYLAHGDVPLTGGRLESTKATRHRRLNAPPFSRRPKRDSARGDEGRTEKELCYSGGMRGISHRARSRKSARCADNAFIRDGSSKAHVTPNNPARGCVSRLPTRSPSTVPPFPTVA